MSLLSLCLKHKDGSQASCRRRAGLHRPAGPAQGCSTTCPTHFYVIFGKGFTRHGSGFSQSSDLFLTPPCTPASVTADAVCPAAPDRRGVFISPCCQRAMSTSARLHLHPCISLAGLCPTRLCYEVTPCSSGGLLHQEAQRTGEDAARKGLGNLTANREMEM